MELGDPARAIQWVADIMVPNPLAIGRVEEGDPEAAEVKRAGDGTS